jgi:hypothetical protein
LNDTRELLRRGVEGFEPMPNAFERVLARRDRKRRNQRITAGVVGIAVFVAAVWIVTTGGAFDRTQTPAVPGGGSTGPTVDPSPGFIGLPPEGATPSEPLLGELVMRDSGIHPRFAVNVYADGRLIWFRQVHGDYPNTWIEQRLSYMGLAMLVSGEVSLGGQFEDPGEKLPASAWVDNAELSPYVPSRYVVFTDRRIDKLPAAAEQILGGTERALKELGQKHGWFNFQVTIEDARALAEILTNAGFEGVAGPVGTVRFSAPGAFTDEDLLEFVPVLPDGTIDVLPVLRGGKIGLRLGG